MEWQIADIVAKYPPTVEVCPEGFLAFRHTLAVLAGGETHQQALTYYAEALRAYVNEFGMPQEAKTDAQPSA